MKLPDQIIRQLLLRELDPAFARRASIIAKELYPSRDGHLLEIGCGRGFYEEYLSQIYPKLNITAIDQKNEYLSVARKKTRSTRVDFQKGNALNLAYKHNSFSAGLATEVLEHLPNDLLALQELYRVIKPGGRVILSVPNKRYPFLWDPINYVLETYFNTHVPKDIWWLAGIWADHERLYTEQELVSICQKAKFQIERVYRSTHFCIPFSHFILYGIGKNIVELGFLPSFYRFSQEEKPSRLLLLVKSLIYAFDRYNSESEVLNSPTVNLIVTLKK